MSTKSPQKIKGLVIVESPAKARKIGEYLGKQYRVMASMGHVRDLPAKAAQIPAAVKKEPWSTLGVNVTSDFEPLYVIPDDKKKIVKELKSALKGADELILATDEDREGESIGWHLLQILKPKVPIKRMVFSEITRDAILKAIENPREVDEDLVSAQETRRVVDRLYGYSLSPLLWKKIARGLSAGRVQSVAVRLLVERELERIAFQSAGYWDLKASLSNDGGAFDAVLTHVNGKRIATGKDFDENTGKLKPDADVTLLGEEQAKQMRERLANDSWQIADIRERSETRRPYPPFTTSTLQQESNRKLNMTARQTMQVAQRLYEEGHITYMRTDSVSLSGEAIKAARDRVGDLYGDKYLSSSTRQFKTKNDNAQEAHEAIRPAGIRMKTAEELGLAGPEYRLYALIWKRTMATQMAEARLKFQTVKIAVGETEFRATGRRVEFPGFFRAYVQGVDDPEAALDDQESALPPLEVNETLKCATLEALAHETKPPARFTEATLVRQLEAEGIGRPSTYASIIGTIQDRGYARKNSNQLTPTFTALAVVKLLKQHFPRLVDYQFTAAMEQTLDDIATGHADRLPYLNDFFLGNEGLEEQVKKNEAEIDPREACTLHLPGFDTDVRVGRYGPFFERRLKEDEVVTASIPDDIAPADITNEVADRLIEEKQRGPTPLGMHPEEGLPIFLMSGPFGPYVQLGEITEEMPKPKRTGIPKSIETSDLNLDQAIQLLSLPKRLGHHPDTQKVVNVGIGRFGPYVLHNKVYGNFDRKTHTYEFEGRDYSCLDITLDAAVHMLANTKKRGAPTPLKELGEHPDDGQQVAIFEGRYGAYVKHGKVNATIPKETEVASVTLEQALPWLEEKAARKGLKKSTRKKAARKKTKKKKSTKKKSTKKKTTRKKATKKKTSSLSKDQPDSATE